MDLFGVSAGCQSLELRGACLNVEMAAMNLLVAGQQLLEDFQVTSGDDHLLNVSSGGFHEGELQRRRHRLKKPLQLFQSCTERQIYDLRFVLLRVS